MSKLSIDMPIWQTQETMNLSDLRTRNVHSASFDVIWPSGAVERALLVAGNWEFAQDWTPEGEPITADEVEFGNAMSQRDFEMLRNGDRMQDLDKQLTDLGVTGIHAELRDGSWSGCASITRTIWVPPIGDKATVLQTFSEFLEAVIKAAEETKS